MERILITGVDFALGANLALELADRAEVMGLYAGQAVECPGIGTAAWDGSDLAAIAKELADLLYVVYGTAVSYGIDMDPVFREVHRSNMSKVGGYKRDDGKWVKPPTYSPAVIEPILAAQQHPREREESSRTCEEVEPRA